MFFSGDPSTRKRVDLGGRSSKERDRKNLLEQTRVERNRRLWLRQQNSAVLRIQKCFRGRKAVKTEQYKLREQFYEAYGKYCQNVDRNSFGPDSDFLCQFLYFFKADNIDDFLVLVQICRLLWWFVQDNGDVVKLFAGVDYSSTRAFVIYRVKRFVQACIRALHQNRKQLKDQLLLTPEELNVSAVPLLEVLVLLVDSKLPWSCKILEYLFQNNALGLLREIILIGKDNAENYFSAGKGSSLERVLMAVVRHAGQKPCICSHINTRYSFASQIITIPFLWHLFPNLQQVFAAEELSQFYIHQMAKFGQNLINLLPKDISNEFPSHACMLGNVLETAGIALSHPLCSFDMAIDLAAVTTLLLEALPSVKTFNGSMSVEDDMTGDEFMEITLDRKLEQQINNAINPRFLLQLTNILFKEISSVNDSDYGPKDREVTAVDAVCGFLHVTFSKLPLERIMTVLAYRTELVVTLWNFMKKCHENQKWSSHPSNDAAGCLLPLAVFCPVYKHMLMIVDNEEFYEQEKPLSLNDIRTLIIILRQVLWQLLWVNHTTSANSVKSIPISSARKGQFVQAIQQRVSIAVSDLLSQLQDWNNRRQFTSHSNFHADGVNDLFISQALVESTRANEILKQAPFLIPFTSRVKIYSSLLAAVRQRHGSQAVFSRNRFRIKRDHILEDAYNQMSQLTEDSLRGLIRVTFVNEFGVEEAGIDGGGIFKDFMENITRAAFDVQYGLFKETADHLLYPNPGSGMIHEQHFQFFHFLGTLLAKAMFEGILVDIPFATFFLSKLKQKYNYLNDLPSLDPELYRHLIFLKHYKGDISELELYFVIVNNEYGEQTEEELIPGGRNLRVTNENVITFIHLVANHRLNFQPPATCSSFANLPVSSNMFHRAALVFAGACIASVYSTVSATLTNGHDLSSVALMETDKGAHWLDTDGNATTIESIFTVGGMDAVRLRIWTDGEYDLNYTLALAQRFSKAGFKIYLDMHFSDTWADPHHQNIPAAWDNSSVATLAADLQTYVTETLQAFTDGGIDLDILSLGNEITIGFLWPVGKLTTGDFNDFATLWKAARQGVTDAVAAGTNKPEIMIHVDNGWNYTYVSDFFTGLFANGTVTPDDVDSFGFSFYPFYGVEATIDALNSSLTQVAKDYNKPLYVAETNWPVACDGVALSADYPVSAEGQVQWVNAIKDVLEGLPNGLGSGIYYWEPAYISVASLGSSCQSALLFDVDWSNWPTTYATALSSVNMFANM